MSSSVMARMHLMTIAWSRISADSHRIILTRNAPSTNPIGLLDPHRDMDTIPRKHIRETLPMQVLAST